MDVNAPVIVTGFKPFNGDEANSSWEAVKLLPDAIAGHPVKKIEVPCIFGKSGDVLAEAIRELRPAAVVCCGQAAGRAALSVEEVAVNVMRATIPDESGRIVSRQPVIEDGPDSYLCTMPLDACVAAARAAMVPAFVSDTAGRYVCNQLTYRVLHALAGEDGVPAGFVHVPCMPSQVLDKPNVPSMSCDVASAGILAIAEACLETAR